MEILKIQNEKEWLDKRKFYITGTKLKDVVGSKRKRFVAEMIAAQLGYEKEDIKNQDINRGKLQEPWALDEYEKHHFLGNKVERDVFVIHDDVLALSPDGLVKENGQFVGGVEVKSQIMPKHIEAIIYGKIPTEYKWQIVHYFLVITELEWLDFISYCPEHKRQQIMIIRVTRENYVKELEKAKQAVEKYKEEYTKGFNLSL